jgi:hypothetical protein
LYRHSRETVFALSDDFGAPRHLGGVLDVAEAALLLAGGRTGDALLALTFSGGVTVGHRIRSPVGEWWRN